MLLAVSAAAQETPPGTTGPAPAPTAGPAAASAAAERARRAVEALRRADDDAARRELFAIGGPALAPLGAALEAEEDVAAWSRLAEAFEGLLRARLQEAEAQIGRLQRDRAAKAGLGAAPAPLSEADVKEAVAVLEADLGPAGYAAARELLRDGAARDEVAALARRKIFQDIAAKLAGEVAAAQDDAAVEAAASRLARVGPLASPLMALLVRADSARAKRVGELARDRTIARALKVLSAEDQAARDFAAESLYGLGDLARPALERVAREGTPDERHRAARLLDRITWSISEELYRRTGRLLRDFEARPWRERRMIAYELEKQGGAEAIPCLRRILERDPSDGVKVVAAESLARLGDPLGLAFLARLGEKPLVQSPEVAAAIAMDQGIRYLQIKRYDRAIAEFQKVLEAQPKNEVALYNLACAYALLGNADRAFEYLERAVEAGFTDAEHTEKDEDLTSLRKDPRFARILDRMRLQKGSEGK
jgi:tetratricopeptide (TPR) repeat protein